MKHLIPFIMLLLLVSMTGCATTEPVPGPRFTSPDLIVGRTWGWEKTVTPVEFFDVASPERYTLQVSVDGKISIKFDCNSGSVDYKIVDGAIQVLKADLTKQECHAGNKMLAGHFVQQLQQVTNYYVQDGRLHLAKPDNGVTMQFKELKP